MMRTFYNFVPGEEGQESCLYIDGEIVAGESWQGWWGEESVGSKTFRQELKKCRDVTVYINSPGGDVFAGSEMYAALRDHPYPVTVKIMGIAASAASLVAMAGDQVLISPVGYMMIHDPWSVASGNARDMEKEAQILREIGEGYVTGYEKKTGLPRDEIKRLLENETYMNAQSAIEYGFADGLWEFDCKSAAQAAMPAAMMSGRRYAPAAYMARMGKPAFLDKWLGFPKIRKDNEKADANQRLRARALIRAALSGLNE